MRSVDLRFGIEVVWQWTTDLRNFNAIAAPWLRLRYDLSSPPWLRRNFREPTQMLILEIPILAPELRITDWQPFARFVDEGWLAMRRLWRHTHIYTPLPRGSRYTDIIELDVGAWGALGQAVVGLFLAHRQRNLRRMLTLD